MITDGMSNFYSAREASQFGGEFCSSVSRLGKKGRDHFGPQDGILPFDCAWHLFSAWGFSLRVDIRIPASTSINLQLRPSI